MRTQAERPKGVPRIFAEFPKQSEVMNSVTAHRPLRDTAEAVSLRYRCSAPPSPRHHAFCFDLAGVFSFFILYGGGGRGRVSPKEKLAEF